MKKIFSNILLITIFYCSIQSQWVDLNINFNGYYGYFLKNDLKFFDENTGWMAGYESAYPLNIGVVLKSTNGGLNWFQQNIPTNKRMYSICIVNSNIVYISGDSNKVIKTTNRVDNKVACIFPSFIPNHNGNLQFGILHRPLFPGTRPEDTVHEGEVRFVDFDHESIWISYCPVSLNDELDFGIFNSHQRFATPVEAWERLKIGGGTPPVLTKHGWMIIYHGVSNMNKYNQADHQLCYSTGVMVLKEEHPEKILYRSVKPRLTPELQNERIGIIDDVVFPTGIDRRDDIGALDLFDVYYGMADNRIGAARLNIPEFLPEEATAHHPEAKV